MDSGLLPVFQVKEFVESHSSRSSKTADGAQARVLFNASICCSNFEREAA